MVDNGIGENAVEDTMETPPPKDRSMRGDGMSPSAKKIAAPASIGWDRSSNPILAHRR
jgi:hypothetical protein